MNELALNIPITKVDAARRLVYGVATAEVADRAGEICDYESTKPLYQKWSGEALKNTNGKSFGNVRSMHGHIAAGKLTAINCNDTAKQIEICAKVVDDAEWQKCVEGVYTGFSQGGAYIKRWQDGDHTRYTAEPHEVSLVDLPCLPNSTFEMIKTDGAREERTFAVDGKDSKIVSLHAPAVTYINGGTLGIVTENGGGGQTETIATGVAKKTETPVSGGEWEQVWRSKRDGECFRKKEELYAHHAKLDADEVAREAAKPALDALEAIEADLEKREFTEGERKDDAKSGDAEPDGSYPIENGEDLKNAIRAYGRSKDKAKTKAHIIARAKALGLTSELPEDWSAKILETGDILKADVEKIDNLGDDSADFTAEIERLKAELDDLAKRGARHSAADQGRIQDIHDKALELGADAKARTEPSATTWETLIAGLSTESSRQMATMLKAQLEERESVALKAHSDSVVALLMPKLDDIAKRVKSIEDQPLPLPHVGPARAVEKGHESKPESAADLESIANDPHLFEKLIKLAQTRPIPMIAKGT